MGGLIARFVDEGYDAYYVRASNDEKDGSHEPGENDIINLRESIAATKILGMKSVVSLNWRNDYTAPIPLNELRSQLIFLTWFNDCVRNGDLPVTVGREFFSQHLFQVNFIFGITECILPLAITADITDSFTPFF